MLTVLEVAGAIAGSVPAPRPGPFIRVVVVVIGVVVGVLVRVVWIVSHHAVHSARRPQVTECRALCGRGPVTRARGASVAGPGRRVASLEPVAGGGPGAAAGGSGRGSGPRPSHRRAVVAEQQDRRARLLGSSVGGALGGGARVPSALRLVLRAQTQQAEHLPVVLPLDLLAPGAWSRRGIARGLLLAGGRRGAAQDSAELQRPQQERGPGEAHLSLSPIAPTPGGRSSEKRKTGLKSREGGRNLPPRRRWSAGIVVPSKVGLQTLLQSRRLLGRGTRLCSFPALWKAMGSGAAARRAGSVWSEGRRRDFKLSGTFAKLHKPFWPGHPSAICSRNAIGNVQGDSSSPRPLPRLPVASSSPPDTLHRER